MTDTLESGRTSIVILNDDATEAASLTDQLKPFGYRIVHISDPSDLTDTVEQQQAAFVLARTHFSRDNVKIYHAAVDLMDRESEPQIIYLSDDASLDARVAAVRAAGSAFITVPFNGFDIVDRLESLGATGIEQPHRVLTVDDDPQIAKYIATVLGESGIATKNVLNPTTVLDLLADFRPELILMDFYMPDIDGRELAAAIRQEPTYDSIPIVFLSAEDDVEMQQKAMGIGGDDFLTKPIRPEHLINAILIRAQRFRTLRSTILRDSLTGLLNHTATKEMTAVALSRMRRYGTEMAFGLVDIDCFKQVNDTYGHPVGDQVLRSLSHLLKQRLRTTDIVGRYGGEEFAVALPETPVGAAVIVMDAIRESFSEIEHSSPQGPFKVTFSCGIAGYPDLEDAEAITQAADGALYDAKEGGRNRVIKADSAEDTG